MIYIRDRFQLLLFAFLVGLSISCFAIPSFAELSLRGDFATRIQNVEADRTPSLAQGDDVKTRTRIQDIVGNIHLRHHSRPHYHTYLEAWFNWNNRFEINEAYIHFPRLAGSTGFRIGKFEVDYGNQHLRRTDFGEAQSNPLIGNSLLDPVGTQLGLQADGHSLGFDWTLGVTNGNDTSVTGTQNGSSIIAKLERTIGGHFKLTGSFYRHDSSVDSSSLAHPSNLFAESPASGAIYRLPENPTQVNLGNGGDVTAWQLDSDYQSSLGSLKAWYGRFRDRVDPSGGGIEQEVQYYGSETQLDFTPSHYVTGRYEKLVDRTEGQSDESISRWQVGLGYKWDLSTRIKLEWMRQLAEDYPSGSPNSAIDVVSQDVSALTAELAVRL